MRAITHPTFRDFFGDELIGHGEHLNVSRITFLFVEAEERARVFAELGDVRACELFEELDVIFRAQLDAEEGTDVAAPLGLSVAAFSHPQRAVQAGIGLLRARGAQRMVRDGAGLGAGAAGGARGALPGAHPRRAGGVLRRDACTAGCRCSRTLARAAIAISASVASDRRVASRIHGASLVSSIIASTHGPYQGRRVMLAALPGTRERDVQSSQPTAR